MRAMWFLAAVVVLSLPGCGLGEDPSVTAGGGNTRYTTTALVLEAPGRRPELCLGGVAESYPPQCSGPEIVGWDWAAVEGEESASGTTWGEYTVVGTWDGKAFTLTEPPSPPEPSDHDDADQFATPCTTPPGGWQVADPSRATDEAMQAALEYAGRQPERGGVWLDQSLNPASATDPASDGGREKAMNDPTKLILNVSFTQDLERHEAAIREIWGGALCVSEASATARDLEQIRREVSAELDGLLYSSIDEVRGRVEVGVVVDDGLQDRLDARYGDGVVRVDASLRPLD